MVLSKNTTYNMFTIKLLVGNRVPKLRKKCLMPVLSILFFFSGKQITQTFYV